MLERSALVERQKLVQTLEIVEKNCQDREIDDRQTEQLNNEKMVEKQGKQRKQQQGGMNTTIVHIVKMVCVGRDQTWQKERRWLMDHRWWRELRLCSYWKLQKQVMVEGLEM